MTVESNNTIAIATLYSEWFQILTPVYQPIVTCTCNFSCALSKLHGIAMGLDWFAVLFAPAVIGRSYFFGICLMTLN